MRRRQGAAGEGVASEPLPRARALGIGHAAGDGGLPRSVAYIACAAAALALWWAARTFFVAFGGGGLAGGSELDARQLARRFAGTAAASPRAASAREALAYAAAALDGDMVRALVPAIAVGEDVDVSESSAFACGNTPLHYACATLDRGARTARELLSRPRRDLQLREAAAVERAIRGGRELFRPGADAYSIGGAVTLLESAMVDITRQLLAAGADVGARNVAGRTPLHAAAEGGAQELCSVLLAAGAPPSAKDELGRTAADLAAARGFSELASSLRKKEDDGVAGQPGRSGAHGDGTTASTPLLSALPAAEVERLRAASAALYADGGGWSSEELVGGLIDDVLEVLGPSKCELSHVYAGGSALRGVQQGIARDASGAVEAEAAGGDSIVDEHLVRGEPALFIGDLIRASPAQGMAVGEQGDGDEGSGSPAGDIPLREVLSAESLLWRQGGRVVSVGAVPYASGFGGGKEDAMSLGIFARLHVLHNATVDPPHSAETAARARPPYVFETVACEGSGIADVSTAGIGVMDVLTRAQDPSMASGSGDSGGDSCACSSLQWSLGGAGSGAQVHTHGAAMATLAYGRKLWLLTPPARAQVGSLTGAQHVLQAASQELAARARGERPSTLFCVQEAGDSLLVPELWGHAVLNLRASVGLSVEVQLPQRARAATAQAAAPITNSSCKCMSRPAWAPRWCADAPVQQRIADWQGRVAAAQALTAQLGERTARRAGIDARNEGAFLRDVLRREEAAARREDTGARAGRGWEHMEGNMHVRQHLRRRPRASLDAAE